MSGNKYVVVCLCSAQIEPLSHNTTACSENKLSTHRCLSLSPVTISGNTLFWLSAAQPLRFVRHVINNRVQKALPRLFTQLTSVFSPRLLWHDRAPPWEVQLQLYSSHTNAHGHCSVCLLCVLKWQRRGRIPFKQCPQQPHRIIKSNSGIPDMQYNEILSESAHGNLFFLLSFILALTPLPSSLSPH